MSLITTTELARETGFRDGASDAGGILAQAIAHAELQIKAELSKYGIGMPSSSDVLKPASLNLSVVQIVRRGWHEGSRPVQATGAKNLTDSQIGAMKQEAQKAIEAYIRENGTSAQHRYYIRVANQ